MSTQMNLPASCLRTKDSNHLTSSHGMYSWELVQLQLKVWVYAFKIQHVFVIIDIHELVELLIVLPTLASLVDSQHLKAMDVEASLLQMVYHQR